MKHVTDGVLRARADGELSRADAAIVEPHLAGCEACRIRAERIAEGALNFDALFGADRERPAPDTGYAFDRLQARRRETAGAGRSFRWLPSARLWAVLAAATAVIVLTTSASSRAVAQKLLSIFRARTVVAVPLTNEFTANGKGQLISDLLAASTTVTKEETEQRVAGRQEASQLAGFPVRLPAVRGDAPRILVVEGARSLKLTVDLQRLEAFLSLVQRPELKLPRALAGAQVRIEAPRGVRAVYGECNDVPAAVAEPSRLASCLDLLQTPAATITIQPDQDLHHIAEIGLQVTGMTADQAKAFNRTIDWTSTAAIPLPRESADYRNVRVSGAEAVLVVGRKVLNWPTRWSLIWVWGERVYSLAGYGDSSRAPGIAESLK